MSAVRHAGINLHYSARCRHVERHCKRLPIRVVSEEYQRGTRWIVGASERVKNDDRDLEAGAHSNMSAAIGPATSPRILQFIPQPCLLSRP